MTPLTSERLDPAANGKAIHGFRSAFPDAGGARIALHPEIQRELRPRLRFSTIRSGDRNRFCWSYSMEWVT